MGKSERASRRVMKSGLTAVTILALLYAVFVFQPAVAWLQLTTGTQLRGTIPWITLIVFAELGRLIGRAITKQEATIMYLTTSMVASAAGPAFFIDKIYRAYYVQSPIAKLFNISDKIPPWWAPTSSEAWMLRTFFHPSWYFPLLLALVMLLLSETVNITMGLIAREIFVRSMKLPFPIQQMEAAGIMTLVEPTEERRNVFLVGVIIAMIYGFILYSPPTINQILTGVPGYAPIPWIDLSYIVQVALPGASFGIATSLLTLISGLILPLSVVISIFIGSVLMFLVANPLLIRFHLTPFADEYFHGMNIAQILYRANLYAWAGPLIGVALGAAIVPLIQNRGAIIQGLKSLSRVERAYATKGQRFTSLPFLLAIWAGASIASVIIVYTLIPAGIIYLLVMLGFSIGWSFLWTMVDTYSIGITGLNVQVPGQLLPIFKYSYISTGLYKGVDIWFIDPIIGWDSGWCSQFKVCELNETDHISYIKTFLIMLPLIIIMALVYVQNFWSIAPIPSIIYQYTSIYWPIQATTQSLWITGKMFYAFDPLWIIGAFVLTLAGGTAIRLLKIPLSIMGIAVGVNTAIPYAITILIGGIISQLIARRFSREWWSRNRMILSAGIALGESLAVVIVTVIGMLVRALWVLPY